MGNQCKNMAVTKPNAENKTHLAFKRRVIKSNNFENSSVEHIRRSTSLPGVTQQISPIYANTSNRKIDETFDQLTDPCISDKSLSIIQTPFHHIEDNTALDNSSLTSFEEYASNETTAASKLQRSTEYKSRFIRYSGGSRAVPNRIRMSKTIKRMFKNVFKYQMNAISCLERFYESQVFKLETDRRKNLALNPENSEFIIKFYDKQLAELEERVYSNLTYICRNRCNGSCIDSSHSSSTNSNSSFKRQLSLPFKHKSTVNRKKYQSSSSIKNPKNIGSSAFHPKILPNGSYQLNDLSYHANDYDYKAFTDGFFSFNNDENDSSMTDNSIVSRRHTYGPSDASLIELKRHKQLTALKETQV